MRPPTSPFDRLRELNVLPHNDMRRDEVASQRRDEVASLLTTGQITIDFFPAVEMALLFVLLKKYFILLRLEQQNRYGHGTKTANRDTEL